MVAEKKDVVADVKISAVADAAAILQTESQEAAPAVVSFGSLFLCASAETITTTADAAITMGTAAGSL